jgi:hypothetical protein
MAEADDDESLAECRICRDEEREDGPPLIEPCACKGSMRFCHLECLLEWLRRSETERLRHAPCCGVCQEPYRLRARGPTAWALYCLRSLRLSMVRTAVVEGATHVLQRPCAHVHCACVRWALVGAALQLCLWQGQLLLATAVYRSIRALLLLDAMLDQLLVPETVMPLLHLALPPICELRPRTLTIGSPWPRAPAADGTSAGGAEEVAETRRGNGGARRAIAAAARQSLAAVCSVPGVRSLGACVQRAGQRAGVGAHRAAYAAAATASAAARRAAAHPCSGGLLDRHDHGGGAGCDGEESLWVRAWSATLEGLEGLRGQLAVLPANARMRRCHSAPADATLPPMSGFAWRSLFPLEADSTLLAGSILAINFLLISWSLSERNHRLYMRARLALARFVSGLRPDDVLIQIWCVEDLCAGLLQLGCAAYCGRITAERAGWIEPHVHPLDFASGDGLALHTCLGLLTLGVWSAVCAAAGAMEDHFAEWRWSAGAIWHAAPSGHRQRHATRP